MGRIPVQNVYYLLCYAWEQMKAGEIAETGATGQTELVDLFAKVLINGTERVLKQGLDRGYVAHSEDTSRPRGRIDFSTSLKRALIPEGKVHCQYDTLSRDVLHNRILKSTLGYLAQAEGLDEGHCKRLWSLQRRFAEVTDVPLRRSLFQQVQLDSSNSFYRFLLHVCSLIERNLVVEEEGTGRQFRDFLREDSTMWKLFEKFVLNFYDREQETYEVDSPHIQWDISGDVPEHMPQMRTDMVLTSPDRTIIIDAKFTVDTLKARKEKDLYRSKHLYQLFAYLQNAQSDSRFEDAEGMLLYPTTDHHLGNGDRFEASGHLMRVCTINLDQDWEYIYEDLLRLVGCSVG